MIKMQCLLLDQPLLFKGSRLACLFVCLFLILIVVLACFCFLLFLNDIIVVARSVGIT